MTDFTQEELTATATALGAVVDFIYELGSFFEGTNRLNATADFYGSMGNLVGAATAEAFGHFLSDLAEVAYLAREMTNDPEFCAAVMARTLLASATDHGDISLESILGLEG